MRRLLLVLVVAFAAIGWASPSRAFVSPGYGKQPIVGANFAGRWKLIVGPGTASTAYEWQITVDYVRIYSPGGGIATEGGWEELEMVGDKHHMKLTRHGPDNVEYHGWIDSQGILTLEVLPDKYAMRFDRME